MGGPVLARPRRAPSGVRLGDQAHRAAFGRIPYSVLEQIRHHLRHIIGPGLDDEALGRDRLDGDPASREGGQRQLYRAPQGSAQVQWHRRRPVTLGAREDIESGSQPADPVDLLSKRVEQGRFRRQHPVAQGLEVTLQVGQGGVRSSCEALTTNSRLTASCSARRSAMVL